MSNNDDPSPNHTTTTPGHTCPPTTTTGNNDKQLNVPNTRYHHHHRRRSGSQPTLTTTSYLSSSNHFSPASNNNTLTPLDIARLTSSMSSTSSSSSSSSASATSSTTSSFGHNAFPPTSVNHHLHSTITHSLSNPNLTLLYTNSSSTNNHSTKVNSPSAVSNSSIVTHLIPPLFLTNRQLTSPSPPPQMNHSNSNIISNTPNYFKNSPAFGSSLPMPRKRRTTLQRNGSNFITDNLLDLYLKSGVGTNSFGTAFLSQDNTGSISPTSYVTSYGGAPTIHDNYYGGGVDHSSQSQQFTYHTKVDIIDVIYSDIANNIHMPYQQYQLLLHNQHSQKRASNSHLNGALQDSIWNEPMSPTKKGHYDDLSSTSSSTTTPNYSNQKGPHLIYILRVRKGNMFSRSWILEKRYSQFSKLHKALVKEHKQKMKSISQKGASELELPKLPPKLLIGNFKPENVQKRKESLQTYLDLVCKGNSELESYFSSEAKDSEYLSYTSVIEFLKLDIEETAPIYKLSNDLFLSIFQFCIFEEIFPVLSLVCKWWNRIIYQSFKSLDMVYCNENVFFLKVSVAIDTIEDLSNLILRFNNLVNLRLHRFYELDDKRLNIIIKNCRYLENIEIVDCGLILPTIPLFRYRTVTLTEYTTMKTVDFSNNRKLYNILFKNEMNELGQPSRSSNSSSNINNNGNPISSSRVRNSLSSSIYPIGQSLFHLDLTNTAITDDTLCEILNKLNGVLHTLNISQCKKLVNPVIEMRHLETLVMRHCTNVTKPILKCNGLQYLDISYTNINDEALFNGIVQQKTSVDLLTLRANSCHQLRQPRLPIGIPLEVQVDSPLTMMSNIPTIITIHAFFKLFRLEMSACCNLKDPQFEFSSNSQLHYVDLRITPVSSSMLRTVEAYMNSRIEQIKQQQQQPLPINLPFRPNSPQQEARLITSAVEAFDVFQPQLDFANAYPNAASTASSSSTTTSVRVQPPQRRQSFGSVTPRHHIVSSNGIFALLA
ncbi:hypothetical protein C9374_011850 [Naegleria lovaniensis]|uniref:PX domain-containing protein n=1 Tax=Naegleria lovaniensis TaxID=51637 RepID=A0AA88KF42_NAELO|nr:uncharacterized protein C9374_011850 [Naegleria lovaniensis]KAG2373761.1 hypothetical protein C9374_011850 [Naegleria lovaniensis]